MNVPARLILVIALLAALVWATLLVGATVVGVVLVVTLVVVGFGWAFVRIVFGYRDEP